MIFSFGSCQLDTARRELHRAGRLVDIEPQVYRLLTLLIENRERVVSRSELVRVIWKGRIISDAAVNSRIKSARAALGDDGRAQKWIRTVQRAGYRFVGEVEAHPASLPTTAEPPRSSTDVQRIVATAETLDNLSLALPSQTSVAILPLQYAGRHPSGQVVADGLTHDITTQVSRLGWLFVAARGSTFRFRAGPYDAREVGHALGVHYVVQGRIQLNGKRLRLQISMADSRDDAECWGETLQRQIGDIFEVLQEVSETIAGKLEARIEHLERRRALLKPPANLDAWEAYHRGCWHMYRFTGADHEQAEHYFRHSIALDPLSPRAYAALSFVHWQRAFLGPAAERAAQTDRTMLLARQALELDPGDPMGHWAVGRAHLLYGDVDQSVDELETSVQLNPSSAIAQYSLSYALLQQGNDPSRSVDIVGKARRLSPFDPMTFAMFGVRGQNLSFMGRYEESAVFAERAAIQPNSHYHVMAVGAYCNALADRLDVATALYRKVRQAKPDYSFADFIGAFRLCNPDHIELTRGAFSKLASLDLHKRA